MEAKNEIFKSGIKTLISGPPKKV